VVEPLGGCLPSRAISSAPSTSFVSMCSLMDQPTTMRENKSSTTARYSQPSPVHT
jgi:hypothetical protein